MGNYPYPLIFAYPSPGYMGVRYTNSLIIIFLMKGYILFGFEAGENPRGGNHPRYDEA